MANHERFMRQHWRTAETTTEGLFEWVTLVADELQIRFHDEKHRPLAVALSQVPALLQLAERCARLNPNGGTIGAGMLATLQSEALQILHTIDDAKG